ncbi:MAG: hypothetical protein R3F31_25405 [Verrucomicrobiales bacterium]
MGINFCEEQNEKHAVFGLQALCLLLAPLAKAEPKSGTVTVAVGDVKVTPAGGAAQALKAGDVVTVGSKVTTGPQSRAVIVMTVKSAIRIAENSDVTIETIDEAAAKPKVVLDIKAGSLGASANPARTRRWISRSKPPAASRRRGTCYAVAVENGKGYARSRKASQIIPAGQPAAGGNAN